MKKTLFLLTFGALALMSCEDVPAPYTLPSSTDSEEAEATTTEALGSGTSDDPYNVTAANEVCATLTKSTGTSNVYLSETVYVKGIISQIDEVSTSYGNAVYYISDDGTTTSQLEVYHGYYLNNAKFTSESQIAVGDTVIVCGQLQNWLGTYEFTSYSYLTYHSASDGTDTSDTDTTDTADAEGDGTLENPYNAAAANAAGTALGSGGTGDYVYVKGIISQIKEISTSYGNASYYISADGTTTGEFYIYHGYGLSNTKFTSSDDIAVGDEVIIYGQLYNYYGTPEFAQGNYIVSLTKGEGTSADTDESEDDSTDDTETADGISVSDNVITMVNSAVTAGSTTVTIDLNSQGYENADDVTSVSFDGGTLTFAQNGGNNAPKFYSATKGVRMYALNSLTITGTSKAIAKAVITCDYSGSTYYVGNDTRTMSVSGNSVILTNDHTGSSGGVQLRVQTIVVTFAE